MKPPSSSSSSFWRGWPTGRRLALTQTPAFSGPVGRGQGNPLACLGYLVATTTSQADIQAAGRWWWCPRAGDPCVVGGGVAEGQTTRLSTVWASSLRLSHRPGRPPKPMTEGDTQTPVGSEPRPLLLPSLCKEETRPLGGGGDV